MIYIYRRGASISARLLAQAVEGKRVRTVARLQKFLSKQPGLVVCWGGHLDGALNGNAPIRNKFTDAVLLNEAKVPTIVCTTKPYPINWSEINWSEEWLPRTFNHAGGNDLLVPQRQVDFFSKLENLVREYRVHWFNGRSLRAGQKVPRDRVKQHPWIRSWDGGWKISYDGFSSSKKMRKLARKACEALELDFGAVDIGETDTGKLIVLEVNRAPGLEGNTITAYANAIKEYANENS